MKFMLAVIVSLLLVVTSAHAGGLVTTTREVFNFVFNGTLIKRNSIEMTQLKPGAQAENRLLYLFADANKGKEIVMVVSRNQSKTMTQMNIEILQPLDARAQKALGEVPAAQLINGQLSPQVSAELIKSDLTAIGARAWENLGYIDGLSTTSVNMAEQAAELKQAGARLAAMTVSKPAPLGVVLDLSQAGPAAVLRLEFGLTPKTTMEEVQAILNAVADAIR